MKLSFVSQIIDTPYGGGNQFLRSLKQELSLQTEIQITEPENADVLLVNSYQDILKAAQIKLQNPEICIIYRLGPIFSLHRRWYWSLVDQLMIEFAHKLADQVVFQSQWSLNEHIKRGYKKDLQPTYVILNAPQLHFTPSTEKMNHQKTLLVASSWSSNENKGFNYLKHIDENLDFSKWEVLFIGNSPISFKNIKTLPPLSSQELAQQLQKADLFFFGSKDDACSNSLLEAIACGLPVLALDSGGNKEITQEAGELFTEQNQIIPILSQMNSQINTYKASSTNTKEITDQYKKIIISCLKIKHSSKFFYIKAKLTLFLIKLLDLVFTKFSR